MKQIKRGDTTAVTRDGREVTQLKWFDLEGKETECVAGESACASAKSEQKNSEQDFDDSIPF